jgi:pantetheine-phosphate adenylyltransferase
MKKVLICGSFDPITRGHADLIARAAALFDEVDVVLFRNSKKTAMFPEEKRLAWLSAYCAATAPNLRALASDGAVAEYTRENGIDAIVRGVRNATDLAYERDMALLNRAAGAPETVILPTNPALAHISSGAVREFLRLGLSAEMLLPPALAEDITATYRALEKQGRT